MNCSFDWCKFFNIVFGGILVGLIASFIFVWLTHRYRIWKFKKRYKSLESSTNSDFDWIAYSMRDDNGRIKRDEPNGSIMNIEIRGERIHLRVHQKDNRVSIGELRITSFDYGILTFKYEHEHEYGKRECIIGQYYEKMILYNHPHGTASEAFRRF